MLETVTTREPGVLNLADNDYLDLARDPAVLAKYAGQFPAIKLFTEGETFGDWNKVQKEFFGDGGLFDQIYQAPVAAQ